MNLDIENYFFLASHDLQEPNRIIISFLTNLEKKYKNNIDKQGQDYIKYAIDGAYYMRKSILNLQEHSKIGKNINISKINLNNIVEDIIKEYKTALYKDNGNITIANLPTLETDENLMHLIFKNLIENAIKFKKQGEKLQVTITFQEKKNHWEFACTDNGIGIDQEYHTKIFELFQRLNFKMENQGTGIGLPITKKAIERLGGKINVKSDEKKGSTFLFTLPKN